MNSKRSTVIISVYKDALALDHILHSLNRQTVDDFEIIVSEDCQSEEISTCLADTEYDNIAIKHLTQKDEGFRKNRALNRAIQAADTDHLIFIDGDCIPHTGFVAAHQRYAGIGMVCSGRRVELGEKVSSSVRTDFGKLSKLMSNTGLLFRLPSLISDEHHKNIECGFYSPFLQSLTRNKKTGLLGCNFSCNRSDLISINGFNEDYIYPGTGEDTDIDWRLRKVGVRLVNVKFTAIQYHLHHKRTYSYSEENEEILRKTMQLDQYICVNGIEK